MSELTNEQKARLEKISGEVKGGYASLPIEDVLNRIHILTDRPYDGCIKGFEMMLKHGFIKPNFVTGMERFEQLRRAVDRAMPIIVAMDATIVRSEVVADEGWETKATFKPVRRPLDLSHVDANF